MQVSSTNSTESAVPPGRIVVFGDIHGCDRAFQILLNHLDLVTSDRVVVLGDVCDRGPGTRQAMDLLLQIERICPLTFIMGNHEQLFLDALAGGRTNLWLGHGGAATLESYGGSLANVPDSHLDLLQRTVPYWESPRAICVHANLEPGVELHEQQPEWLHWQRLTGFEYPHPSGRTIVCGHTGQPNGLPLVRNGWICLDTLAYTGRFLTCMDLVSESFVQSRQTGEIRQFPLSDLV